MKIDCDFIYFFSGIFRREVDVEGLTLDDVVDQPHLLGYVEKYVFF